MRAGEAKIHDADVHARAARFQYDIVRLQVAMNDASGMQCRHAGQQLLTDLRRFAGFQFFATFEPGIEGLPLQQPHGEEQKGRSRLVTAKDLVDRTEIGVNHLAREKHLLLEAGRGGGIAGNLGTDNLQRDARILKKLVPGLIDLTHPSAGNKPNNGKAAGNELSGVEAAQGAWWAYCRHGPGAIRGKGRSAQKTTGARILQQKLFEPASQVRIMAAHPLDESSSAFRG